MSHVLQRLRSSTHFGLLMFAPMRTTNNIITSKYSWVLEDNYARARTDPAVLLIQYIIPLEKAHAVASLAKEIWLFGVSTEK
jgi:hypothetical protein